MIAEKEWLDSLKPGDEVAVHNTGYSREDFVTKVDRVTRTQLVIGSHRYAIATGRRLGDSSRWTSAYVIPATAEIKAAVFERKIRADIARIQWDKVPLANLLDVLRQIPELK